MMTYEERYDAVMSRMKKEKQLEKHRKAQQYSLLAAAAVVVITAGALALPHLKKEPQTSNSFNIIEKHVPNPELSDGLIQETVPAIPWDKMIDPVRFAEATFEGRSYSTKLIAIHADHMGALLGEGTARGQDLSVADGEIHEETVKIYAITGMDPQAAVAVSFHPEDEYAYAYVNAWYTPATLGEFIDALNLKAELGTGLVYFESPDYDNVAFEDVPTEKIWEMLLSDVSLVNEPDHEVWSRTINISTCVNVLGYHYHSISLTEDGYLMTNILETGKYFYIGPEKVEQFKDYLIRNHQAYRYIYDVPDGPGIPENENPGVVITAEENPDATVTFTTSSGDAGSSEIIMTLPE